MFLFRPVFFVAVLGFDVGSEVPDRVSAFAASGLLGRGERDGSSGQLGGEHGEDQQVEQDERAELDPEHRWFSFGWARGVNFARN
ncbi:hypothetical protein [Saccharopolyspora sp. ASAGF58]|uniref:hypothetical protein n=1 Tax=Saccharopolyspora sp. ASAGF58 TaxID=2719023 RepID=UPI001445B078|nr:hypothetical protein [Saccharopolyspora sp. ASAGF58]